MEEGRAGLGLAAGAAVPGGCSRTPLAPVHLPASRHTARARSSVPSGRVGNSKDAIFRSNEHFRGAVADREAQARAGWGAEGSAAGGGHGGVGEGLAGSGPALLHLGTRVDCCAGLACWW